nr:MAG TPA: hypothetical protein [Bacteriophage sp.]
MRIRSVLKVCIRELCRVMILLILHLLMSLNACCLMIMIMKRLPRR